MVDCIRTHAEDLMACDTFSKDVLDGTPTWKLLGDYAPDRSIRWMQRLCKTIRENDASNNPTFIHPTTANTIPTPPMWSQPLDFYSDMDAALKPKPLRIPPCAEKSMQTHMQLVGNFVICGDFHIPFYHAPTLERLMDEAANHNIDKLIIAGDLFDFNMFHHGPRGSMHQRRGQDDVEVGREVLKGLLHHFNHIDIIMGNHDLYLAKDLRNHFDIDFLFSKFFGEFKEKIRWSGYGHCDVGHETVSKRWKIIHGSNFSETNAISVAKKLADKFQKNIILGHQHKVEEAVGNFHCVCIGGAHDASRMGYLNIEPSTNAIPRRSFALLKDGECIHIKDGLN